MTDDYLQLSGLQHFAVCPRQWALINIERKWTDNWRTIDGINMHERAHSNVQEKRGDIIITRSLKICSHTLRITGECDVVEFKRDAHGVEINGCDGLYLPFPIEYKRGNGKSSEADSIQLCAQAMCLEEMLLCKIERGALFYGEPHRRFDVEFTEELRKKVSAAAAEIHKLMTSGRTPKAVQSKFCTECSLANDCLPYMEKKFSVCDYIKKHVEEAE